MQHEQLATQDEEEEEAEKPEPAPAPHAESLEVVVLGTGAGSTAVYHGQPSSSFVIVWNGRPVLLADCGFGVVKACLHQVGVLPDAAYVSHNHTDHSGDLPVMLAVESSRRHVIKVLSHDDVQRRLQQHRMHELKSTGKNLSDFALWQACPDTEDVEVQAGLPLTLRTVRSRHSEVCYGALFRWRGKPVLGWSADSGWDTGLYCELSKADVLLLDARAKGTQEHAGFEQIADLARHLCPEGKRVLITGYGAQSEAPKPGDPLDLCGAEVVRPGQRIQLLAPDQ